MRGEGWHLISMRRMVGKREREILGVHGWNKASGNIKRCIGFGQLDVRKSGNF